MEGTAIHDGVLGCMNVATAGVEVDDSGIRRSNWETVRSVEAARTLFWEGNTATSRKGFADAVYIKISR